MLVWKKKKSAGAIEKNSVSVFRVFEQKKRKGVCRFLNPDLATRDTGTRRHTGTKEKSEQRSQQQQQHAIIILTKSRKVNNTTINAHQHHFVGATDNRKFFFIICRVWVLIFESFVVVTNRWWDPIFPEEGRVSKNLRREWFERIFEPFFWWIFFFLIFSSLLFSFSRQKKNDRIFCRTQRATQRITHVSPPFAHEKRRRTSDYTKKARIVVILSLLLL